MKDRIKKLQKILVKEKLDAFLVFLSGDNSKNLLYLTGFGGSAGIFIVTRKKSFLFVDSRYIERVRNEIKGPKIVHTKGSVMNRTTLTEALKLGKINAKSKVGYESGNTSILSLEHFKKSYKTNFVPTRHIVERLRATKDKNEIKEIRLACRITDEVFKEIRKSVRSGQSENSIAALIDYKLRLKGGTGSSFATIVASGPNSAIPHHQTSSRRLRAGEPVILDFGVTLPSGYCSDLTRTIFVPGKNPSPKMMEIYNVVLRANQAAFKGIKAGLTWTEYDNIAREYIKKRGYGSKFTHDLGHSLGLDAHDPYDYQTRPIEAGTVATDEPGIYINGLGGVRIEDDLLVTKRGAEKLTRSPYLKFSS